MRMEVAFHHVRFLFIINKTVRRQDCKTDKMVMQRPVCAFNETIILDSKKYDNNYEDKGENTGNILLSKTNGYFVKLLNRKF